jgi:acyl-CoA thioester hydrolase
VIESHVRYVQGIEFEQKIKVRAILKEWENRLKIEYLILDAETGRRLTKGYTTQVAVNMQTREMCYQSPQILLDCLNAWDEFKGEVI